ncbi:MAG: hypothetical protein KC583_16400, partial [Myxococcales bacterium]|nr:hypothetical protein [Myxococcales bacterium]
PCERNVQCASRLCLNARACFGGCTQDADCPGGRCTPVRINGPGEGVVTELMSCTLPPLTCEADAECADGRACVAAGEDPAQPNRPVFACLRPPDGLGRTGEPCAQDADCLSDLCLEGVCWGLCRRGQDDCLAGQVCYDNVVTLTFDQGTPAPGDDAFFSAPACLPDMGSGDPCPNKRCGPGETCLLFSNSTWTGFDFYCREQVGPRLGGAPCNFDADCQSGVCAQGGFCIAVCDPANPGIQCAPGAIVCQAVELTVWDAGTPNDDRDDRTEEVPVCLPLFP